MSSAFRKAKVPFSLRDKGGRGRAVCRPILTRPAAATQRRASPPANRFQHKWLRQACAHGAKKSQRKTLRAVLCSLLALGVVPVGVPSVASEDFRVENEVFLEGRKKADSRSTTIFRDGIVYDYLEEPPEVIVFDKPGGRFVLLETTRRVRTELTTQEVVAFTERLQKRAEALEDPFVKFLAAPQFEEQYDEASGELTLSSPWMTYRLLLADAESPAISQQYRESCDWYARLNTLLNPGSKPPFARLAVNAALAKREAIPRQVRLTLTPENGFPPKRTTIRSRHRLVRRLAQADLDRVAQTRQFMQIFKLVGFEQYRQLAHP
jgi:hypothetical protein